MLTVNYKVEYGEIRYRQQDKENEEQVIKIHKANALCAFIRHYSEEGKECAELISFFADEQHIRNLEKEYGDSLSYIGEVTGIRLNIAYKESMTLLRHFVKNHKVLCYYETQKAD